MDLENRLTESLQKKGKEIVPSPVLKKVVMYHIYKIEGGSNMKKRIIISVLAVLLLIPTTGFAYQVLLSDDLYGSFEHLKRQVASITMDKYIQFNMKLSQAKGELGEEEYENFTKLLKVVTSSKLEYGDEYGNVDYEQLSSEKATEIKQAMMVVQPYYDKLNGVRSSKEILTSQEFNQYIEALMTYETIMAKSEIDTSKGLDRTKIPEELREEFIKAQEFISYVDEKLQQDQ